MRHDASAHGVGIMALLRARGRFAATFSAPSGHIYFSSMAKIKTIAGKMMACFCSLRGLEKRADFSHAMPPSKALGDDVDWHILVHWRLMLGFGE